jgi:HD superfamily phosphohydrolase
VPSFPANKKKIINDPVHGFINISYNSTFDLIEHSYFQRLRRIKQLGLTNYVYPGACHTRFQHALGAAHLMGLAIDVLRSKGQEITGEEAEASVNAILLHDIGHGPFSHALENSIIEGVGHEELSLLFMERLNRQSGGSLELSMRIFRNDYPKNFLHELVTGQLDADRMDYLKRDSFFTGVTEGVIGSDRIIKMLNVVNDRLVVESKGIYSIEKFLIARRLMYWQVYLHKAVLAAEVMMVKILQRARQLCDKGIRLFADPDLDFFLNNHVSHADFSEPSGKTANTGVFGVTVLDRFANLDDNNIISAAKVWRKHSDTTLSLLCNNLIDRKLFRMIIADEPFGEEQVIKMKQAASKRYNIGEAETGFFVHTGEISNNAYSSEDEKIRILFHDGQLKDIAEASDMLDLSVLSKVVRKHYICYPKELE